MITGREELPRGDRQGLMVVQLHKPIRGRRAGVVLPFTS